MSEPAEQHEFDEQQLWQEYERRKREWQRRNPCASPAEYNEAIREIARELDL